MLTVSLTLAQEVARGSRVWRDNNAREYGEILSPGGAGCYTPPRHGGQGIVDGVNRAVERLHCGRKPAPRFVPPNITKVRFASACAGNCCAAQRAS